MKLQLHNITSEINEKKSGRHLATAKAEKAEKTFISFLNYNSNKAFEGEGKRDYTGRVTAVVVLQIRIYT
jgi:hypothetical protein